MASTPYFAFGKRVQTLREQAKEKIADLAVTMEIDEALLHGIEAGVSKPSEDIVQLIINHFNVGDKEADKLWDLAGYGGKFEDPIPGGGVATIVLQLPEVRTIYTDSAQVSANRYGVSINFMQTSGADNKPMTVSRIGMSLPHAKSLAKLLERTIKQTEEANKPKSPKQLGGGDTKE